MALTPERILAGSIILDLLDENKTVPTNFAILAEFFKRQKGPVSNSAVRKFTATLGITQNTVSAVLKSLKWTRTSKKLDADYEPPSPSYCLNITHPAADTGIDPDDDTHFDGQKTSATDRNPTLGLSTSLFNLPERPVRDKF